MFLTSNSMTMFSTFSTPPSGFRFESATGAGGLKKIFEPLLDTEIKAKPRAISEFLREGYIHKFITLTTWRTDLKLLDIILVHGIRYKIIDISIGSDKKVMKFKIRGMRYE